MFKWKEPKDVKPIIEINVNEIVGDGIVIAALGFVIFFAAYQIGYYFFWNMPTNNAVRVNELVFTFMPLSSPSSPSSPSWPPHQDGLIFWYTSILTSRKGYITNMYKKKKNDNNNNPLESFDVNIESNYVLFDNTSINLFVVLFFIIILFTFINNNINIKKNIKFANIINLLFSFFFKTFKNLIANVRFERYFVLFLGILLFIVLENIGGFYLIELSFNSHAIVTLFLSFIVFFNFVVNYIVNFNELIYKKFLQSNLNIVSATFLFFIEIVSFFIRPFSLGIRLFANIMSGHILIHIFFGVYIYFFNLFFWYSIILLFFCLFILGMEIFVSLIQGYIFFILSCIYLKDVSKVH